VIFYLYKLIFQISSDLKVISYVARMIQNVLQPEVNK